MLSNIALHNFFCVILDESNGCSCFVCVQIDEICTLHLEVWVFVTLSFVWLVSSIGSEHFTALELFINAQIKAGHVKASELHDPSYSR